MEKIKLDELQLAVMQALWKLKQATVSELRDALTPERDLAHTTIGTILTRLEKKGIVAHHSESRQYVYRPLITESGIQGSMVSILTDQLFGGNTVNLANFLIRESDFKKEELDHLRKLIESYDNKPKASNE
ncbi:MAG TPA: BlaI/MecI/CopY family transcriptional regulator [Chitinophagaceae bacterium]|jgi:predicted transcriptional regulator|nr:BlaI/MecI/CopY family transcriptional regulator [Chitinophagaceae bacterium]